MFDDFRDAHLLIGMECESNSRICPRGIRVSELMLMDKRLVARLMPDLSSRQWTFLSFFPFFPRSVSVAGIHDTEVSRHPTGIVPEPVSRGENTYKRAGILHARFRFVQPDIR